MKPLFILLLIAGIILRLIFQFIFPVFNSDEIALGNNIKNSSFIELLEPLKYGQSSPPLFLWTQKAIITISPLSFWINIKILSFLSSITCAFLFFIFIQKNNFKPIFLLLFIILLFNPFTLNNSLTVKQYTIDLTGVLFMLVYFNTKTFQRLNWIFFFAWSLMSNIGIFACTAYIINHYLENHKDFKLLNILNYIKENILTILSPLPYVIYFIWFMQHPGAMELKNLMVDYWQHSFIPLNSNIFKYAISTTHSFWIFHFSAFEEWGIVLSLLTIPFFFNILKKNFLFKKEIQLLSFILLIHFILNIIQLYPFSDRLYLYLSPLVILVLGSSLTSLTYFKFLNTHFFTIILVLSLVTLSYYSTYMFSKDNDIIMLYKKCNKLSGDSIYLTENSLLFVNRFNDFTDNKFSCRKTLISIDSNINKSKYIVSRVHKKIKRNVSSQEDPFISESLKANKIKKIDQVNGYNIYQIVNF